MSGTLNLAQSIMYLIDCLLPVVDAEDGTCWCMVIS